MFSREGWEEIERAECGERVVVMMTATHEGGEVPNKLQMSDGG